MLIAYFNYSLSILLDLDEETLCKNITAILVKDCVTFKENEKVGVEIPDW